MNIYNSIKTTKLPFEPILPNKASIYVCGSTVYSDAHIQISAFGNTLLLTFLMTGLVSYLFYANRIFQFPLTFIAIVTVTVLVVLTVKEVGRTRLINIIKS